MGLDPSLADGVVPPLLDQLERMLAGGADPPPVVLLNGPVGAGKTTLGRQLETLAEPRGFRLAVVSIDDLYLPWAERRRRLAGNPFGVSRVPPGSHDIPLLLERLDAWRRGGELRLPRFDKSLAGGQGDRAEWRRMAVDALVIEGWLMGCRPLGAERLAAVLAAAAAAQGSLPAKAPGAPSLEGEELRWLPRWDGALAAYRPLWEVCQGLWLLRPASWALPRRWRFQAEARQRRAGGGWLRGEELDALVRASLCSLPPALYQDPLLRGGDSGLPLLGAVVLDRCRRCRTLNPPGLPP
jgi:D-glycerate 3-kinase